MEDELRDRNEKRFSELLRAMANTNIPTARPAFDRPVEATGLTMLSLALRLNHVIRVTENLKLINTDHLARTVSLDVDLRNLTTLQREALAVHELRLATGASTASTETGGAPERLWVPISRHSREDLAPVVVKDADGRVIPRLTQQAATNAVVAGVARLFRNQVSAQVLPDDEQPDRDTKARARWLIEAAIARLIEHGMHGKPRRPPQPLPSEPSIRHVANKYLLYMDEHQSAHYAELLRAASREYFLIVMLPARESHQFLTYEAPLIPAVRSSTARRRAWRALLPFSTEFTVDYVTQIPRSVGSYHVTVDVPEEIDIRRFILSSDAEEVVVDDLAERIGAVTDPTVVHATSVIAAERREVEAMLGVLGQRRQLDVEGFDYYLQNRDLLDHRPGTVISVSGAQSAIGIPALRRLQGARVDDALSDPGRGHLGRAGLAQMGRWIKSWNLGFDVSTDNDPRENGAHAQWRPVPLGFGHPSVEPVEARIFLALADEPPALVESVARMVGALVLVVLGVFAAAVTGLGSTVGSQSEGGPKLIDQADAAVAVLLIVPGILLTRLDIQATHSVLGRLRRFPQMVAYLSVAFTTGLAMIVAANSHNDVLEYAFGIAAGLLLILLVLCYLEKFARHIRRGVLVPASATIPAWLRHEFSARRRSGATPPLDKPRGHVRPDVYFDAIRPVPNTTRVASRAYEDRAAKRSNQLPKGRRGTPEGPALLADLAARSVAHDFTMTQIEITHSSSLIPQDTLEGADERLYVAFGGISFQMAVKNRREHDLTEFKRLFLADASTAGSGAGVSVSHARWVNCEQLSPIAIRSFTSDVDFLVGFGHISGRAVRQQKILGFLSECLGAAAGTGIVPTLVNTPTSSADRHAPQQLQLAAESALRLTFSVPYGTHKNRLVFESRVETLAVEWGVRLWRASQRPDAGKGDWEPLTALAASKPDPSGTEAGGSSDPSSFSGRSLIPITFLGERGDVGVAAFRRLTKVLREGDVSIAALTASVLGQHAVVNVLAEAPLDGRSEIGVGQPMPIGEALAAMLERGIIAVQSWNPGTVNANIPFSACIGVGRGGAKQHVPLGVDPTQSLWIDWELPLPALPDSVLAAMFCKRCESLGPAEIRFWRSRSGSDDRVRGRAKLAIDLQNSPELDRFNLGDRAKAVQSELLGDIQGGIAGAPAFGVFLHVVWSEPWLSARRGT